MKTFTIIMFILAILFGVLSYLKGERLNWEMIKKHAIIYFATCGGGLNIYIIYQLLTGI